MNEKIDHMLAAETFAVVGASRNPEKYGYLVYTFLRAAGKRAFAVNPNAASIDGDPVYPDLASLPVVPNIAVLVVPPAQTDAVAPEIVRLGIRNVWMQPGAESQAAVAELESHGVAVVAGGPCIMVGLRTHGFKP